MKFIVAILIVLIAGVLWFSHTRTDGAPAVIQTATTTTTDIEAVTVIAENLVIPWDIAFLPQGELLVTERTGHLIKIDKDDTRVEIAIQGVRQGGEAGLLGLLLHPNFETNHYLYLYLSSSQAGENSNRVERYKLINDALTDKKVIFDSIPGAIYHDGGRMEFGPDGKLYVTTGDATRPPNAQDKESLSGKILRLNDDGTIPPDNPFGTALWSFGHRNPQGLAWDSEGRLWETEHGPTGELGICCRDEINIINKGANYGWPTIAGERSAEGLVSPVMHSGTGVWAPSSLVYLNGKLYFGGLKGEALSEAVLEGEKIVELKEHFKGEYGRIRTVRVGPDNMLYITTSNRDGRGSKEQGDDKIIRINPNKL